MTFKNRAVALGCLLAALGWGVSAQAQFLLSPPNNGAQWQIGTGLPLPVGPAGIFLKGKVPAEAATFPPLLVKTAPGQLGNINQTTSGKMTLPPGILTNMIPAADPRDPIAVFNTNKGVFQVRTTIDYSWPSAAAVFAPGGGPGVAGPAPAPVVIPGPTGSITYSGSTQAFGGSAQFAIVAGPNAGVLKGVGGPAVLPPNGAAVKPVATVWINWKGKLPASVASALLAGASAPAGVAQVGAPLAAPGGMTAFGPGGVAAGLAGNVTAAGKILASMPVVPAAVPSNMVTTSKGYPWTTGLITVAAPAGGIGNPKETFYLSGTDMRTAQHAGNISLVSGALSLRQLSGPNANRGWVTLTLPEPTAVLGSVGALAMLGLCHGLVRRRSR